MGSDAVRVEDGGDDRLNHLPHTARKLQIIGDDLDRSTDHATGLPRVKRRGTLRHGKCRILRNPAREETFA
jgi:hypothetical protein